MSWLSGYQKGRKLKNLRRRIIKIAASYVGQRCYGGNSYTGFGDPKFEERIKGVGWRNNPWCNYTVRLIYKEALTTGNEFIGESTYNKDGGGYNTWENGGDGKYLVPPVNKNGKTLIEEWPGNKEFWAKSAQTSYVEYTRINYQAPNRYINITGNQAFNKGITGAKNQGIASRAKEAIEGKYVLPGDFVTFDTKPNENDRFNNHIGIYICPNTTDCSRIMCIEGNYSAGLFVVDRDVKDINGFGQLITRETI